MLDAMFIELTNQRDPSLISCEETLALLTRVHTKTGLEPSEIFLKWLSYKRDYSRLEVLPATEA